MTLARITSSLFILSSTFFSAQAMSQTIREQALAETKIVATAQTSATDAQTTGMLVLKDPRPEILTRSWQYFAGFTAQNFQPEGKATNTTTTFDLGENGSTFMPGLTLGVMGPEWNLKSVLISVGVRGDASFASQSVSAVLPSGFTEEARLNTTLMSAGPALNLRWEGLRWLGLTFTPQFGSLNYTQTSSNDFAHFSKRAAYTAMAYGLDFRLTRKWSVFTEWSQRSLNDSNQEIALQKDNFELGTKVSW